jgi:hypothetical protein
MVSAVPGAGRGVPVVVRAVGWRSNSVAWAAIHEDVITVPVAGRIFPVVERLLLLTCTAHRQTITRRTPNTDPGSPSSCSQEDLLNLA